MQLSRIALAVGLAGLMAPLGGCRRIDDSTGVLSRGQRLTVIFSGNQDGEIAPCG